MKKIRKFVLVILIQFLIFALGCKTTNSVQSLHVTASGSAENPIHFGIGKFFSGFTTGNFIDTANANLAYNFVPGETLSINRDSSVRLFYSDSLVIDYRHEKPIFRTANADNKRYNQFFNDFFTAMSPVYEKNSVYLFDKKDNIILDEQYIDNYLSSNDSLIMGLVNFLCDKYQFPQNIRSKLMSSKLETNNLGRSFFYLGNSIPALDSMGKTTARLQYYINQINQQSISIFSQGMISYLVEKIAHKLIGRSMNRSKSKAEIESYYADIQQFFERRSITYDYLASVLEVQAKANKVKFRGRNLRSLKRDAKKSIFKKYVQSKYLSELEKLTDSPQDKGLYDYQHNSTDLSNLISQYKGKPLLIDFWASWCLPCIKKMPETIEYGKKYPELNLVFISIDRSHDNWKYHLYNSDLRGFTQYRRNYTNQDSLFQQIQTVPTYGLLNKDGQLVLFDEINDADLEKYFSMF